ncbi:hypothetical protein LK09_03985 [Microbacterium mangrovi]|uniref:Fimbrial assembly protein n=1 Tax=Microbacterium mangrovi TaxID=1348253 RepID=A0A0B2ABP0_9MICO|nr:hypothetical protein [Microbacterium mangrovi]KHK99173.1 hypothetical protein LK09_03985 [Microbacterium mangrovi]
MARKVPVAAGAAPIGGAPRVNLLPRSEVDKRERETLTGKWIWGIFATIVVAALLIGAAFVVNFLASVRLVSEQATTNTLLVQIAGLSDVSTAMASEKELKSFRADAMGADFAWSPVFVTVSSALPSGVTTTGFDLTSGAVPSPGVKPADAVGLTGTITLTSPNAVDMAAVIRKLRAIPDVISADGQSLTGSSATQGAYTYLLNVTFDQSIYSGAYTAGGK